MHLVADEPAWGIAEGLFVGEDDLQALLLELDRTVLEPLVPGQRLFPARAVSSSDAPEERAADDRRQHRGAAAVLGASKQIVGEEQTDLVARQELVPAVTRNCGGDTIAVRVVGNREVGVDFARELGDAIHRARLLRVRERDGGKPAVGLGLLGDALHVVELRGGQHAPKRFFGDAVKGRVGDPDRRPLRGVACERRDRFDVRVSGRFGVEYQPRRAPLVDGHALDLVHRLRPLDCAGDSPVMRRNDLSPIFPVDLVSVVARRIVARRDHHTGCRLPFAHRERNDGCRHHVAE